MRTHAMRYAIVIEDAGQNYSAYAPDLPGCVATGHSPDAAATELRAAIVLHVTALRANGETVPVASSRVEYVDVAA